MGRFIPSLPSFRPGAPSPSRRIFSQSLKLFAALLLSFLLLEGGLGLYSLIGSYHGHRHANTLRGNDKIIIFCEGDAFTWGLGGKSYPAQLEELLNARAGREMFQVINNGVPDKSVGQSAREFPALFNDYRPDAVILLSGGTQEYEWRFAVTAPPKTLWRRLSSHSRVLPLLRKLADMSGVEAAAASAADRLKSKFGKKLRRNSLEELSAEIERAAALGDAARCLALIRANQLLLRSSCEVVLNSAHKLAAVITYEALEDYIAGLINADLIPPEVIQNVVNSYRFKVSRIELPVTLRAQHLCELGIKKWPLSPDPYICAAEVCARPGQYKLAQTYAKKAIELAPNNHRTYAMLSDVYALQGEYGKAEEVILSFSKAGPELKRKIPEIQFRSGKYALAALTTEKYLVANPGDPEALRLLVQIYRKLGRLEKVEQCLKRLLIRYPEDPMLLYDLSAVYAEMRRTPETRRYCQLAIDAQPANSEILFSCQAALTHLGDTKTLRPKHAVSARVPNPPADGADTWQPTPETVLQSEIRKSILSIYEICRRANVPMILSVSPNRHVADVDKFAAENGIPYVSIEALFSPKGGTDRFISFDNAHFNTEGYRILAGAYADMLWSLLKDRITVRPNDSAQR